MGAVKAALRTGWQGGVRGGGAWPQAYFSFTIGKGWIFCFFNTEQKETRLRQRLLLSSPVPLPLTGSRYHACCSWASDQGLGVRRLQGKVQTSFEGTMKQ